MQTRIKKIIVKLTCGGAQRVANVHKLQEFTSQLVESWGLQVPLVVCYTEATVLFKKKKPNFCLFQKERRRNYREEVSVSGLLFFFFFLTRVI